MGLATRQRTRAVLVALAAVCALAALDGSLWWRVQQRNASIAAGTVPAESRDLPAEMRFAQATALVAGGNDEAALNAFTALQGETPLGLAARYNSANLLLRQAERVRAGPAPGQAIPLVELAKETLREVLRHDTGFWDARYNLERAQRLLPDPEEGDTEPEGPQRNAERAATTMRSFSPGLP